MTNVPPELRAPHERNLNHAMTSITVSRWCMGLAGGGAFFDLLVMPLTSTFVLFRLAVPFFLVGIAIGVQAVLTGRRALRKLRALIIEYDGVDPFKGMKT